MEASDDVGRAVCMEASDDVWRAVCVEASDDVGRAVGAEASDVGRAVRVEASGRTTPGAVAGGGGGGGGEISGTDLALAVGELGGWEEVGERGSLFQANAAHGGEEGERRETDRRVATCVVASVVASCLLTKELEAGERGRELEAGERGRELEAGKRGRTDRRLTKGPEEGVGGRDGGGGGYGRLSQLKSHWPGMPIYIFMCTHALLVHA